MKSTLIATYSLIGISLLASSRIKLFENKSTYHSFCFNQDTKLTSLIALNLDTYKNKAVEYFVKDLPQGYTGRIIHQSGNSKYAKMFSVLYPDSIRVSFFIRDSVKIKSYLKTMQWDLSLLEQEKIRCIEIWHGSILFSAECPQYIYRRVLRTTETSRY